MSRSGQKLNRLADGRCCSRESRGPGRSGICMGLHLAQLETRLGLALFFRHCAGARIADSMTDEMMEPSRRFITVPRGGVCNVTMRPLAT